MIIINLIILILITLNLLLISLLLIFKEKFKNENLINNQIKELIDLKTKEILKQKEIICESINKSDYSNAHESQTTRKPTIDMKREAESFIKDY